MLLHILILWVVFFGTIERRFISISTALIAYHGIEGTIRGMTDAVIGFDDAINKTAAFTNLGRDRTMQYAAELKNFSAQMRC